MSRLPDGIKPRTTGSLINRSEQILAMYDLEVFCDSGDAESYAAEMADILEKWIKEAKWAARALGQKPDKE